MLHHVPVPNKPVLPELALIMVAAMILAVVLHVQVLHAPVRNAVLPHVQHMLVIQTLAQVVPTIIVNRASVIQMVATAVYANIRHKEQ